ncbi:Lignostilbene-alpha,beta-dioxygenase isozyme I [Colletotrichum spinosum]|uniref:Lignostilbene-alpha,beta-dioxygenase isozyme I n=1 Tax=Colletotrichum spinosum TaxID=1347390 RepID=A0A4R8Q0L1_9PEZI|nr:Lignostilbene-alpha,beta-dioxygenase isozyme I [Colletotrichum spinosum]
MDMHRLKPLEWQRLPSKVWPGMDKASWPPCDANFDNTVSNRPTRYEGEVCNLEVYGKIHPSISGTFYRIMPEPYHVPFVENDVWLNGDGEISSFRVKNGSVDFKQRFVKTEKARVETMENRALIGKEAQQETQRPRSKLVADPGRQGKYRNTWTDLVDFADRTMAFTDNWAGVFSTLVPMECFVDKLKEGGNHQTRGPIGLIGPRHFFQEPQFDPRHPGADEGNGYLVALVNSFDDMSSELVIVDCDDFEKHAAIAKLPVRLRPGFHGNWVDDSDIDGRPVTVPESAVPHRGNGSNGRKETNGE